MHLKLIFISLLLVSLSCNQNPKGVLRPKKDPDFNIYYDSLKTKLMGKWGGGGEREPALDFRADSVYFYDQRASHPYRLNKDTLIVKFLDRDAEVSFGKIIIIKDTLIWHIAEEGFDTYAYRYKGKQ